MKFDAEEFNNVYSRPDVLFDVWIYTVMGLIGIFVGFKLSHVLYCKYIDLSEVQAYYYESPINKNEYDISDKNFRLLFFLFLISVITLLLYRQEIGGFPLESIFLGLKGNDLALLRSDATNNFSGKMYRYVMLMEVMPLFLFIIVSFLRGNSISRKFNILFYCLLFYNIFYTLITLQKAPIINFILLCYIIYTFRIGLIKKKPLIIVGSISVILIILMYVFFMGVSEETPITEILGGALHRVFISSIMPLYWYIIYVGDHGLLLGTSFPNPMGLLPFEHFRLPVEIMDYVKGAEDVVGSMPTVFIGEMYANFGIVGILISSILVGFILQTLDIYFWNKMSYNKSVLLSSLFVYIMIYFHKFTFGGISGVIIDTELYMVVFLSWLYYKLGSRYLALNN